MVFPGCCVAKLGLVRRCGRKRSEYLLKCSVFVINWHVAVQYLIYPKRFEGSEVNARLC